MERGLAESREKAQALIMAGEVLVDGQKAAKPGQAVDAGCRARSAGAPALRQPRRLQAGGRAARTSPSTSAGQVCLDIGSSTGGFTDALLQAGAARVHAVDVGAGQLAWKLRTDPRVVLHEGINARDLRLRRDRRAGGPGHLRRQLHFRHADSAGRGAAVTAGRANGYTDQTAV